MAKNDFDTPYDPFRDATLVEFVGTGRLRGSPAGIALLVVDRGMVVLSPRQRRVYYKAVVPLLRRAAW